ncbi:MAG: hypothetical protein A2826_00095 [Candidatus Doudnabacteria bacterium RIFCSPHIGHO2_01_FULL_43_23]|uniref:Uncharacterized protein n=1 Tax=Candidatus Doudnabacteria bacterium RIFCSPHIGHO2_01_FULL_43_23 TaxID=1817822 RepID=A0A1F5NQH0_9BACT|nr:MAG: hypothetical protein A2826_00095 [Candidatus Doudnabacteria bacterium RIFCSPHIGHO2_01_FULL_43_23]
MNELHPLLLIGSALLVLTVYYLLPYGAVKGMKVCSIRESRRRGETAFYKTRDEACILLVTAFLGPLISVALMMGYDGEGWILRAPKELKDC